MAAFGTAVAVCLLAGMLPLTQAIQVTGKIVPFFLLPSFFLLLLLLLTHAIRGRLLPSSFSSSHDAAENEAVIFPFSLPHPCPSSRWYTHSGHINTRVRVRMEPNVCVLLSVCLIPVVCADLVGAGGVGIRVWPSLKASPDRSSRSMQFRLLQVRISAGVGAY